jgi:hypothetical protein
MIKRVVATSLALSLSLSVGSPSLAKQGLRPHPSRQGGLAAAIAAGRPFFTTDQPNDAVSFRENEGQPPQTMSTDAFATFVQNRFSGRTIMTGDAQHGWQVEYTSPEGQAFLWYPGNERLAVGRWRVTTSSREITGKTYRTAEVCFSYPEGRNPATGAGPGQEECENAWFAMGNSVFSSSEWRSGDPFHLAGGVMPYKRAKTDKPAWPQP